MTMVRDGSATEVACDFCVHGETRVRSTDVYDVAEEIKKQGWRITRKDREWLHTCPDCQTAEAEFEEV